MNGTTGVVKIAYQCPVCGNALLHLAALPPFDAPCYECGSYLWCRRRDSAEGVVLEAVAGRAPELWEVQRVVDALGRFGTLDRVTVDLSQLDIINSSFLAALVGMKKRLQPFGCTLFLRGLQPIVCEIFDRLRLNEFFNIVKSEEHATVCARKISTAADNSSRSRGQVADTAIAFLPSPPYNYSTSGVGVNLNAAPLSAIRRMTR